MSSLIFTFVSFVGGLLSVSVIMPLMFMSLKANLKCGSLGHKLLVFWVDSRCNLHNCLLKCVFPLHVNIFLHTQLTFKYFNWLITLIVTIKYVLTVVIVAKPISFLLTYLIIISCRLYETQTLSDNSGINHYFVDVCFLWKILK